MIEDKTIFAQSKDGRRCGYFDTLDDQAKTKDLIPSHLQRKDLPRLPEVTEPQLVRHYVRISQKNHCIDTGFYPLGSCTMKYNPKVHEQIAALPGFAQLHPHQQPKDSQGALELLYNLQLMLAELTGLDSVTLQPAAGAHGEFTGLMLMRAYHEKKLREKEIEALPEYVLIPDTAHGTNPASVTMAGFKILSVPTDDRGGMDLETVQKLCSEKTIVGLMLTNPSTLGLFDEQILEIAKCVHQAGGLLYYDGANFNAIMGKVRPGDMGFDIVHFNTHKTFSTPHGGGGPGSGPVAVSSRLSEFLPVPRVIKTDTGYDLSSEFELTIGSIKHFWGNFGVLVRAYCYLMTHGKEGVSHVSEMAVLNANYLLAKIKDLFDPLYGRICMHEFVISAKDLKRDHNIRALDISKRLIDYGYHPPTMYFPLLIPEALMFEPTETETMETLDEFADALRKVVKEAHENPELLLDAPYTSPVRRVDEVRAVKEPILREIL